MRESNVTRGSRSWVEYVRTAKAPELPVVLLEDTAALIGLVFALFGVAMTLVTGQRPLGRRRHRCSSACCWSPSRSCSGSR